MIKTFEQASGYSAPYEIAILRVGDLAEFYACPQKAKEVLSWQTHLKLQDMVASSWKWQSQNPEGYN